MKLPNIKILDESNKILHEKSEDVVFPLDSKTKKTVKVSVKYKQPENASILPEQAETYTFKLDLRYAQA